MADSLNIYICCICFFSVITLVDCSSEKISLSDIFVNATKYTVNPSYHDVILGYTPEDIQLRRMAGDRLAVVFEAIREHHRNALIKCLPYKGEHRVVKVTSDEFTAKLNQHKILSQKFYMRKRVPFSKQETIGPCMVLLFYAGWCKFSAFMAPHYNALPRAFPDLEVLAIDVSEYNTYHLKIGMISVPSIVLFHNAKPVAKFKHGIRILDNLVEFVANISNLTPNLTVGVSELDFEGPLSSDATTDDTWTRVAWFTLIMVALVDIYRSRLVSVLIACFQASHEHLQ